MAHAATPQASQRPRLQPEGIRHRLDIEARAYLLTALKAPQQRPDWIAIILRVEYAGHEYTRPLRFDRPENRHVVAYEAAKNLGLPPEMLLADLETVYQAVLDYLAERGA